MESFAVCAVECPDSSIPVLRELLSYDMLCESSCSFTRMDNGTFLFSVAPSPLHWSRQMEWPWIIKNLDWSPSHRVLDIGGGYSVLKFALAKRCYLGDVVVLDNDPVNIELSKKAIERITPDLSWKLPIRHVLGDALALPFLDNTFDRVVCVSVLEHLPNGHLQGVQEAVRVLKPGGRLLLTMDVVVDGVGKGNFFVNQDLALEVCQSLGIPGVTADKVKGMAVTHIKDFDVWICVVMICYFKPMV